MVLCSDGAAVVGTMVVVNAFVEVMLTSMADNKCKFKYK